MTTTTKTAASLTTVQAAWLVGVFFAGGSITVGASDYGRGSGFRKSTNRGTMPRRTAEAFARRGLVEIVDGVMSLTPRGIEVVAALNGAFAPRA